MAKYITQHRRGTEEQWSASNPRPADGEVIVVQFSDNSCKLKVGDGKRRFSDLPYIDSKIENAADVANSRIDNLIELIDGNEEWPEGSAEAEVIDMRTDHMGYTHEKAGDMIRELSEGLDTLSTNLSKFINADAVNGLKYENNILYLTADDVIVSNGVEIKGGSGGGGGGASSVVKLTTNDTTTMSVATGSPVFLNFTFTSLEDDIATGDGTCSISVNGITKITYGIAQGDESIDVTKYLSNGTNNIRVTCTDIYGNWRTIAYTVTVVELKIDSNFNDSIAYDGDITFRYTPYGLIDKKIYFKIDGDDTKIPPIETKVNGRELTQTLPAMSHGVHRLDVYMTASLNDDDIPSNHLIYDIICIEHDEGAMIASVYEVDNVKQGELVSIPYIVYDPTKLACDIVLTITSEDGEIYSTKELTVDRAKHYWSTRHYPVGNTSFTITCGDIVKTHTITVKENHIDVEAATDSLELYLTSAGRSNDEANPAIWGYADIETSFTGFNWKSNGWIEDEQGDVCLRLNGDARAKIKLPLFKEDFKKLGKTIEFEFAVRDVNRRDAIVIDCYWKDVGLRMTSDTAKLKSLSSEVTCKYKDEEKIRVSFTVDSDAVVNSETGVSESSSRLISVYIDGVLSGVQQYPAGDNFEQSVLEDEEDVYITVGSSYCGVDLYTVRVYNTSLDPLQMTRNYIADMSNVVDKMNAYDDNNIYDDNYNLSYAEVKKRLPVITFVGDMPKYKGDKKKNSVRMIFEHPDYPELNFDEVLAQIDVQGTSSADYVRKNWKTKHNNPLVHIVGSIPAKVFCIKVDYAEATGTHNTQNANFVETLYDKSAVKDKDGNITEYTGEGWLPSQKDDPRVRSTIQGFPCVIFEKATENSDPVFSSKANFNYDKGSENAFGFTEGADIVQSWEFGNNYTLLCNFLKPLDLNNEAECFASFEARYPDGYTDLTKFKQMYDWVYSTRLFELEGMDEESESAGTRVWLDEETRQAHLEEFKTNFTKYFDLHYALIYYVYTFFALMTDQRSKNMFLTYWAETDKWYPYFYDNDTCFGINNKGKLVFDYYHEDQDVTKDGYVFNGANNVLWYNFAICFADEIRETYKELRSNKKITYDALVEQFITKGSDAWSASIYNEDAEYKYISMARPASQGGSNDTSNLYQVRGSGEHHLRYFLQNRIKYCDSKWKCGDFMVSSADDDNNVITFRLYTPPANSDTFKAVRPSASITVTPFSNMYCAFRYGRDQSDEDMHHQFIEKDVKYTYDPKIDPPNELETYIYGAQEISSLGDLSPLYSGLVNVSAAKKLVDLKIGNDTPGYSNTYLSEVRVGTNRLLKKIDVTNCTGLGLGDQKSLDLSNCPNIEEIYATGTNLQSVDLPDSGYVHIMRLPGSVNNLNIRNQLYITELTLESYNNVKQLSIDNCPTLDTTQLLDKCLYAKASGVFNENEVYYIKNNEGLYETKEVKDQEEYNSLVGTLYVRNVERVRLTGIEWKTSLAFLRSLYHLKGLDELGYNTDNAHLVGTCHIEKLTGEEMAEIYSHYPYLEITYDELDAQLIFMDSDGTTELCRQTIYNGGDGSDPVADKIIPAPIKESTAQYNYTFSGWSKKISGAQDEDALKNVEMDRYVYPTFDATIRSYTVNFYNGNTLLQTVVADYGSDATYTGETPVKPNISDTDLYEFTGWSPKPENIQGDTNCYAQFYFNDGELYNFMADTDFTYDTNNNELSVTKYIGIETAGKFLPVYDIVEASYNVVSIGGFNDTAVELIVLPDGVRTIDASAFDNCTNLISITIPSSVTTISSNAFRNCNLLDIVYIDDIAKWCEISFTNTAASPLRYAKHLYVDGELILDLIIPEGVKTIKARAFNNYNSFTSLVMPNTVTDIESMAFYSCNIKNITFSNNLVTIGPNAFVLNSHITNLEIPNGVTTIGSEAFDGWSAMKILSIPSSVTTIGSGAFQDSMALETIIVDSNNAKYRSTNNCLIDIDRKAIIAGCKNSIIPSDNSVAIIDDYAFRGCKMLNDINIPNVIKSIGASAFRSCEGLTSIIIPSSVININNYAFAYCNNLSQIEISEGVQTIGNYVFQSCVGLTNITLPDSIKTMGDGVFSGCPNLTSINVPWSENEVVGAPWGATNATVNYNYVEE